jgi:hypothetical protein
VMSKVWIILALLIPSIGHADMAWEFAQRWHAASALTDPAPDYLHYWAFSETLDLTDIGAGYNGAWSSAGGTRQIDADGVFFPTNNTNFRWINLPGPITNTTSYTISVWAKPNKTAMDAQVGGGGWMLSDRTTSGSTLDFQMVYSPPLSAWRFVLWNTSASSISLVATNAVADAAWVHLAISVGPTNAVYYVDGVLSATASGYGTPNDAFAGVATIGTSSFFSSDSVGWFRGYLDFLRVYQRVLTADEIQSLHIYEKQRSGR